MGETAQNPLLELLRTRDQRALTASENAELLRLLRERDAVTPLTATVPTTPAPIPSAVSQAPSPLEALGQAFQGEQRLPFQPSTQPAGQNIQEFLQEAEQRMLADPQVQLTAGAIIGGGLGSLVGQPFLGTLSGTLLTKTLQDIVAGEFTTERATKTAITETVVQGAVAGITRGGLTFFRAGLRMTPAPIAFLMNELGTRTRGIGERVIRPLTTQAVRQARQQAAAARQLAGYADVTPLVQFARNLKPDERTLFLRFLRSIQPVSGRAYEVLVRGGDQLRKLPFRVKAVPLDALEGMRQQIGRQVRQLERTPGQELAARMPAGFRSTLVRYRATIDRLIEKTIDDSGLDSAVIRTARQAHFRRVAADALEQRADRFFRTRGLVLQFNPDAFITAVQQAGSRRGDIIGRAMKDVSAQTRWQTEVRRMAEFMRGIQFERGLGPLTLKLPIVSRVVRRLSNILADEGKLNIFNRAIQRAGQRFILGERVIPVNIVQIAIAAADVGEQSLTAVGQGAEFLQQQLQPQETIGR